MARLLYLVHRIPFPPNKGDKIRSYNLLKALAQDHEIVLGSFVDDPSDLAHVGTLEALCQDSFFQHISPKAQKLKSLAGLLTGSPLSITFYRSAPFQAWVDRMLKDGVDGIVLFSSAMARFMRWKQLDGMPIWMDFVDLDSDKWRQYAQSKTGPEAWLYGREARTLAQFERRIAAQVTTNSFVTDAEVALFQRQNPSLSAPVVSVPNGVDLAFFHPSFQHEDTGPDNEIVFTGAMDYWANVDAVTWFADHVLPRVQEAVPNATFTIVGSKPAADVLALQAKQGVSVTGFVEDVRDYVSRAKLCVAPMRIARGVQNKVLEAMAMGKAVVATTAGYEGIQAQPGADLLVRDDPAEFAQTVISLINDEPQREQLGARARYAMEQAYDWEAALSPISRFAEQCGNTKF
jgi:sugar transferase (PEP-CTERM/EpsH1 system associated)